MMARSSNAPSIGRIQKRKTKLLQIIIFGLQRAAGPYRWANRRHRGCLFNDLVGHCENVRWQIEAERFRGFEIDHEFELGDSHHW